MLRQISHTTHYKHFCRHIFFFVRTFSGIAATAAAAAAAQNSTDVLSSPKTSATAPTNKIPISFLDLRGSGLSVLERLLLEECLLQQQQHDNDRQSWVIAGYHDATQHRYLKNTTTKILEPPYMQQAVDRNESAVIVMGIGGKAEKLLHIDKVRQDAVMTIKRFSGGGTVVIDHDSIWTTIIGRPEHFDAASVVEPYPRPLMEYSAQYVFAPLFEKLNAKQREKQRQQQQRLQQDGKLTMVMDTKSCAVENTGRVVTIPSPPVSIPNTNKSTTWQLPSPQEFASFSLRENDYVLGDLKMGGNAQSIGKNGWLHHTSFLWDYQDEHMMDYLTLPHKRPEYRKDRSHHDFLVKLSDVYPALKKSDFVQVLRTVCEEQFTVRHVTVREAMDIVQKRGGGLQAWWEGKSRTRLVHDL